MKLSSYYFLQDFGNEGKIRTGKKVDKIGRNGTSFFFRIGVLSAVLNDIGTVTVLSKEWVMGERREANEGRQDLTRTVRGSS